MIFLLFVFPICKMIQFSADVSYNPLYVYYFMLHVALRRWSYLFCTKLGTEWISVGWTVKSLSGWCFEQTQASVCQCLRERICGFVSPIQRPCYARTLIVCQTFRSDSFQPKEQKTNYMPNTNFSFALPNITIN